MVSVRYIGVCASPTVGAQDAMIVVRAVLKERRGKVLFGRLLRPGEVDDGSAIDFDPDSGEELRFEPADTVVALEHLSALVTPRADGYTPVAGISWTWLATTSLLSSDFGRHILSAARRLDQSQLQLAALRVSLGATPATLVGVRDQYLEAFGAAELMCIALSRAVDMLKHAPALFALQSTVPAPLANTSRALKIVRDSLEHIDERARGLVRKETHPDALSIFDQTALLKSGELRYAKTVLSIDNDLAPSIDLARELVLRILAEKCGSEQMIAAAIVFSGQSAMS